MAALLVSAALQQQEATAATDTSAYNIADIGGLAADATDVIVDSASQRVFVGSPRSNEIEVVDGLTRSVASTIALPLQPTAMALDAGKNRLFVVGVAGGPGAHAGKLAVVDLRDGTVTATVSADHSPSSVAVDPVAGKVFVTEYGMSLSGSGMAFDESGNLVGALYAGPTPTDVAVDPGLGLVYSGDDNAYTLTVSDAKTLVVTKRIQLAGRPGAIAVDDQTHQVYIAEETANIVGVLDPATNTLSNISVGTQPWALALDSSARKLFVGNVDSISVVDTQLDQVVGTIATTAAEAAVDQTTHTVWVSGSAVLASLDAVVSRRAGLDRYKTAAEISAASFDAEGAGAVVLARADTYPDALVGAPLAATKNAPLLYTSGSTLPAETKAEIERVLAHGRTVYLLGGTSAVPQAIASEVSAMGYTVVRVGGANRYATAVAVADQMGDPTPAFLATARTFADALAAGPPAALEHGAVLLTDGPTLPAETRAYLDAHQGDVYAIGGAAASADPEATPIQGSDRYATAALVAERFFPTPTLVGIASGTTFADALPAAAYLGKAAGPLLLAGPTGLPAPAGSYLSAAQGSVNSALIFGGSAAVPDAADGQVRQALGR
ncbi:MAG TPA: cell wall-binding repeat-containing protein [Acidothermaceae bacterium]|nr:cell wall-binding repeat-containing protein [Acidothermaceae bacterium]